MTTGNLQKGPDWIVRDTVSIQNFLPEVCKYSTLQSAVHASCNHNCLPGDVCCILGCKVGHACGHVPGRPKPLQEGALLVCSRHLRRLHQRSRKLGGHSACSSALIQQVCQITHMLLSYGLCEGPH